MKKQTQFIGRSLFWLGWPGLWALSRLAKKRSRIIVVCGNEVLLLKDWLGPGKWTLPGGGIKLGEDSRLGAIRELKEETGLIVTNSAMKFYRQFTSVKHTGMNFDCEVYYTKFAAKPQLKLHPLEIAEARWVTFSKLHLYPTNNAARVILEAFRQDHDLLK